MSVEDKTIVETTPVVKKEKKSKKSKKEAVPENVEEEVKAGKKRSAESAEADEEPKKKKKKKSAEAETPEAEVSTAAESSPTEEEPKKKKKKSKKVEEEVAEKKDVEMADASEEKKEEESAPVVEEKKEAEGPLKVFIGGLPFSCTEETVKKDFEECGEVVDFFMPLNRETGQIRGIAFCTFTTQAAVKKALEYNETDYGGRNICVRVEEDKGGKGKGKKGDGKKGKGKGSDKPEGCMSVCVKFITPETTEEDVRSHLADCGEIERCSLLTDRETGESKCICFVDFASTDAADEAMKKNYSQLNDKEIFVGYNAPREKGGDKGKGKGKGKDGKGKGKKGGKGKGKKGKDNDDYAARASTSGSIQTFAGKAMSFDSDSD